MSDYTPSTEEVREMYWECSGEPRRGAKSWAEFDRWLASVKAEAHRDGYDTARQDLVSGAFVEGPTYEALRGSATGHKIAADALRRFRQGLIDNQMAHYGIVLPDVGEIVDALDEEADRIEGEA